MIDITEIFETIKTQTHSAFFYTPLKNGNEKSYLFTNPINSIVCNRLDKVNDVLSEIDLLSKKLKYACGYISYEAGYSFEEKLKLLHKNSGNKLISFNFFNKENVQIIPTKEISFKKIDKLLSKRNYQVKDFRLNQSQSEYEKNIEEIKRLIAEGDTYQVNYTLKSKFNFTGDISSFVAMLLFNQSAEYSVFINDSDNYIISTSPELFFKTEGERIIAKPMKGTIKRGANLEKDNRQLEELLASKKDRAENIMIVDLLRNDIGKISEFNSIAAKSIFEIEKYESLYQMTSTVNGILKEKSLSYIIQNIFPCGSITGAPKIKTMEIISRLEKEERGLYTGTIGLIENGELNFNVPIRTIIIDKKNNNGEMGIGSGIVWDSNAKAEFEETKLKSFFLTNQTEYFELLETMLIKNGKIFLLEYHIERLRETANYFLFNFNENKIRRILSKLISTLNKNKKYKVRLLLTKWGEIRYSFEQLEQKKSSGRVIISEKRTDSNNTFLYFKTTNRELYNSEFTKWGSKEFDDVLFLNEKGEVTEGAISNILISKNNRLYTSPLSSGLLNGCYRKYLLDKNDNIIEKKIFINDLLNADSITIFNSVRGETKIVNIIYEGERFLINNSAKENSN
jgi:para-aminobenzoate synthetase/4-amino-4-deoxychorismate lyase